MVFWLTSVVLLVELVNNASNISTGVSQARRNLYYYYYRCDCSYIYMYPF